MDPARPRSSLPPERRAARLELDRVQAGVTRIGRELAQCQESAGRARREAEAIRRQSRELIERARRLL